jgi:hypothetical protein
MLYDFCEFDAFSHRWTINLLKVSSIAVIENIDTSGFHVDVLCTAILAFQNCNREFQLFNNECA